MAKFDSLGKVLKNSAMAPAVQRLVCSASRWCVPAAQLCSAACLRAQRCAITHVIQADSNLALILPAFWQMQERSRATDVATQFAMGH